MKKLVFFCLLFHCFNMAKAQDSTYVKTFNDFIHIKAGLSYRALNITLSPRTNGLTQFFSPIFYRPSVRSGIGLDVAFKGLSIGYSFGLAQNTLLSDKQRESKYTDFQLHSLGKKIGYDFYYQEYQGYFIEDLEKRFAGIALEQRDDIRLKNISANIFYVFNGEKFSYSAAFSQNNKQLKNAGSPVLISSFGYFSAIGDSSFIPTVTSITFDPSAYVSNVTFYTFSVSPGYAYTYLLGTKGWHISASASGLVGLQYNERIGSTNDEPRYNYFLKGVGRGYLGYHGQDWIFGASVLTDIQGLNTKYVQYRTNNLGVTFSFTYKIKTKFMQGRKSFFDKIVQNLYNKSEKTSTQ